VVFICWCSKRSGCQMLQAFYTAVVGVLIAAYYLPSLYASLKLGDLGYRGSPVATLAMYCVYLLFFASVFVFGGRSPNLSVAVAGLAVACCGVALHFLAVRSMRHAYSAHVRRSSELVTDGFYALVRHPIYSSALVFFGGLALFSFSPLSTAAFALVTVYIAWRIAVEERVLCEAFGYRYKEYRARVPATIFGFAVMAAASVLGV